MGESRFYISSGITASNDVVPGNIRQSFAFIALRDEYTSGIRDSDHSSYIYIKTSSLCTHVHVDQPIQAGQNMSSVKNSRYPASPTFYFLSSNPEHLSSDEDIEHPKLSPTSNVAGIF